MVICAVAPCKSLFRKGSTPSSFAFPRDPAVRAMCVKVCKRADNFDPEMLGFAQSIFGMTTTSVCCSASFVLICCIRVRRRISSNYGKFHRPSGEYLVFTQKGIAVLLIIRIDQMLLHASWVLAWTIRLH